MTVTPLGVSQHVLLTHTIEVCQMWSFVSVKTTGIVIHLRSMEICKSLIRSGQVLGKILGKTLSTTTNLKVQHSYSAENDILFVFAHIS